MLTLANVTVGTPVHEGCFNPTTRAKKIGHGGKNWGVVLRTCRPDVLPDVWQDPEPDQHVHSINSWCRVPFLRIIERLTYAQQFPQIRSRILGRELNVLLDLCVKRVPELFSFHWDFYLSLAELLHNKATL